MPKGMGYPMKGKEYREEEKRPTKRPSKRK